jgi:DMSO/TMAO reductase YedYZ molybdopterin-dependent catalytic subunit
MRHCGVLILFLFASLSIAFLGLQLAQSAIVGVGAVELPSMSLTVVGADGIQVVLNETGVAGLPFYRGYGGFKNQLGHVKGLGNYTGVSLNTLCGLVGGLTSACIVNVSASDYSSIFTFDEVVNGNFTTYNSDGDEVPHSQPLVPIVAYYFNDENIIEDSGGPLRLAIVGPEGLVTDSTHWVKWVVRVEVIDETIPEFPSPMVLSLLLFVTSIVVISFKAFRRKQLSAKRFMD